MKETLRQLLPQFLIMMVLYSIVVIAMRATLGISGFAPQMAVALVIAFGYPRLLRRLGREPAMWERPSGRE